MPDPAGRRLFVYGGTSNGKTTEPGLFVLDTCGFGNDDKGYNDVAFLGYAD